DLKPSNIMLSSIEGGLRLKLLDFGLSKSLGGEALTGTGQTVGTCKYMAPEQFGDGTIDPRADVYAMGVVFYEMLSGKRPFEATDPQAQLNLQLAGKATPLAKLLGPGHPAPPELISLVERCLAADRNKRPQDAGEVARQLDHALDLSSKRRAAVILPSGIPDSIPSSTVTGSGLRTNEPLSQTRSSTRTEVGMMAGMATAIMGIGALIIVLLLLVIGFGWYSMSKQGEVAQPTEIRSDQVAAFRKEGLQALTAKDYDKAVTMFQVAVEKAPEDSDIKDLLRLAIEARDRAAQAPPPAPAPVAEPEPEVAMVEPEPEPEPSKPEPSRPSPSPSPSPKPTPKPVTQAPKPKPVATVTRPAPAPVVKTGTIFVASAPKGLSFSIPGVGDGVTPSSLNDVPAGTFMVTFYDGGRAIHTTSVEVKAGEGALIDVDLSGKLTPEPAPEPVAAAPTPAPAPAPAPAPEPQPEPAPVAQPATMAANVARGDLEVSSPNVFGEVWASGVRCGPAPVVCKGLPAGSVTIEIRSGKKVLRTTQANVVADTRSRITVR
ncbi:MAG: serine/threonine protein kinase, partial [Myxococcales bacterium]|nr:serine/threonine protein kinase [Myxococcales bacterium]